MLSLRYLYVLALVLWVGGMVIAGLVVAPSTFGVLQAADPASGRVLAGQVFGEVLRRINLVAYVAGIVMLLVLTTLRILGPRPKSYGIRVGIITLMLALTAYSGAVISPRIATLQREVTGPMSALPASDGRRIEFDGLHGLSTTLMMVAIAGGLLLVGWEARE